MEIQKCSLLLKKQKNCFELFTRNRKSFVSEISLNTKYSLIFINIKNDAIQEFKCKAIKFTA